MYYAVTYSRSLSHHGIKGQKWGVRRYRNEDGSLTPEGRKRYLSEAKQKYGEASSKLYFEREKAREDHENKFLNLKKKYEKAEKEYDEAQKKEWEGKISNEQYRKVAKKYRDSFDEWVNAINPGHRKINKEFEEKSRELSKQYVADIFSKYGDVKIDEITFKSPQGWDEETFFKNYYLWDYYDEYSSNKLPPAKDISKIGPINYKKTNSGYSYSNNKGTDQSNKFIDSMAENDDYSKAISVFDSIGEDAVKIMNNKNADESFKYVESKLYGTKYDFELNKEGTYRLTVEGSKYRYTTSGEEDYSDDQYFEKLKK